MGSINGWIYLGLGIAVSGVSFWSNSANNNNHLLVFQYIGFVLAFIGAFKIVAHLILGKKLPSNNIHNTQKQQAIEHRRKLESQKHKILQHYNNQQTQQQTPTPHTGGLKVCPQCGLKNAYYETHCERCNTRLTYGTF